MHQKVGKVHQLADGAAAVHAPRIADRGDTGAVIAAIFQSLQRLDDDRGGFVLAEDTDNSAHQD